MGLFLDSVKRMVNLNLKTIYLTLRIKGKLEAAEEKTLEEVEVLSEEDSNS